MSNQSLNGFYTWFLLKFGALPQDVAFPLDIAATSSNNLSPEIREFSISEVFQVLPSTSTENNIQGNQRFLLVMNAAVEAEKKTRTIKAALQPESRIYHTKTLLEMLKGNPSTQMYGLGISYKYE